MLSSSTILRLPTISLTCVELIHFLSLYFSLSMPDRPVRALPQTIHAIYGHQIHEEGANPYYKVPSVQDRTPPRWELRSLVLCLCQRHKVPPLSDSSLASFCYFYSLLQ